MKAPKTTIRYWLFKSEPDVFGISHLRQKKIAPWDGIRNYQVRNLLRDEVAVGDIALFYHSNTKIPGIVGEMEVVKGAFPDVLQFDLASEYFDKASTVESPRWLAVTVKFRQIFPRMVTLKQLRADALLSQMTILRKGNRLSITEVTEADYHRICLLAKKN